MSKKRTYSNIDPLSIRMDFKTPQGTGPNSWFCGCLHPDATNMILCTETHCKTWLCRECVSDYFLANEEEYESIAKDPHFFKCAEHGLFRLDPREDGIFHPLKKKQKLNDSEARSLSSGDATTVAAEDLDSAQSAGTEEEDEDQNEDSNEEDMDLQFESKSKSKSKKGKKKKKKQKSKGSVNRLAALRVNYEAVLHEEIDEDDKKEAKKPRNRRFDNCEEFMYAKAFKTITDAIDQRKLRTHSFKHGLTTGICERVKSLVTKSIASDPKLKIYQPRNPRAIKSLIYRLKSTESKRTNKAAHELASAGYQHFVRHQTQIQHSSLNALQQAGNEYTALLEKKQEQRRKYNQGKEDMVSSINNLCSMVKVLVDRDIRSGDSHNHNGSQHVGLSGDSLDETVQIPKETLASLISLLRK